MGAEQKVAVRKGPNPRGIHVGSTVVSAGEQRFWVSTVDLGRKPKALETLIFPIPKEIEVIHDSEGKPEFSGDFPLYEVFSGDIPGVVNVTNMRSRAIARSEHQRNVNALARFLKSKAR